jgi:hypothetical protein
MKMRMPTGAYDVVDANILPSSNSKESGAISESKDGAGRSIPPADRDVKGR